jgi:serine/threonine protein kinase
MTTSKDSTHRLPGKVCPTCGLKLDPQAAACPRDGTNVTFSLNYDPCFQNFEFIQSVGSGGMGIVYKARHRILDKLVAIKTLHAHRSSPEALMRFQLEGKATSSLSHRNIVGIHDFGVTQAGQAYMVIDYVDGKTLADVIAQSGQLTLPRFYNIFVQVCSALEHAHSRWILHRDVKPSNIMIVPNKDGAEDVRVMDFGIAKFVHETVAGTRHLTKTGEVIGSPPYMSPEHAKGENTDARSDLYSLGCVMYESLTGVPPFQGKSEFDTMLMHLEDKPFSLKQASMGREFDQRLDRLILKLLEKDPAARYQSMSEVETDLRYLQSGAKGAKLPSESAGSKPENNAAASLKRFWLPAAVAIVLLSTAAIYITYSAKMKRLAAADAARSVERTEHLVSLSHDSTALEFFTREIEADRASIDARVFGQWAEVPVTDADLAPFKGVRVTTENLKIPNSHITDEGLQSLLDLHLRALSLSHSRVQTLRGLEKMKTLEAIDLQRTKLAPEGFDVLSQLTKLNSVDLSFSNIKDSDLQKLYALPLKTLRVENTALSRAGVDDFIEKHPDTQVMYYPAVKSLSDTPWLKDAFTKLSAEQLNRQADKLEKSGDHRGAEEAYWNAAYASCIAEKSPDHQMSCEQFAALGAFYQHKYLACIRQLEASYIRVAWHPQQFNQQWLAILLYRKANAEEKMQPTAPFLRAAIKDRENAENIFVQVPGPVFKTCWYQYRGENLSGLADNLRQLGGRDSLKKAAECLQKVLDTPQIPESIKLRGKSTLDSIKKQIGK